MARHVLTPTERRDAHIRAMQIKRETMSPAETGKLMYRTIWESIDAWGEVKMEDLLRANLPEEAIVTRFETILAKVLADRKAGKSLPVVEMKRARA